MDSAGSDEAARRTTITDPPASGPPRPTDETAITEAGAPIARADGRPRQIGPYLVTGELGRGGMGVVYSARDTRLDRLVAIKVVRSVEDASPDELARFRIEARAVAALHHPNIVAVHDVGEDAGRPYLVMSLVEGPSLRARLEREGPLEPVAAARLVAALARAVGAAHARGVLHRDLKPSNVLLRSDGAPVLTDFGLAKQAHATDGPTATGAVLGTPAYMSPEQALAGDVGPASDVWGLGAVLFECLCGRPPFVGSSVLRVLDAVVREAPPRPDVLRPELPRALADVVVRCLEKEPSRRYPDATALADDLEAVAAGRAIEGVEAPVALLASREPDAKGLRLPPRPPRRRALFVPLLALTTVAAGLWGVWRLIGPPPPLVVPPDAVARHAQEARRDRLATLRGELLATGSPQGPDDPNVPMASYWKAVAQATDLDDTETLGAERAVLQRAAAGGDAWATDLLGAAHLDGALLVRKDLNQAKTLLLQAALTRPSPVRPEWRRGGLIAEARLAEVAALRSAALPTLAFRAEGSPTAPETTAATEILADAAWERGRCPDRAVATRWLLRRVRLGLADDERRLERLLAERADPDVLSALLFLALEDDSGSRREALAVLAAVYGAEDGPRAPGAVATLLEGVEGLGDVTGIVARRAIERAGPAVLREPLGEVGLTLTRSGDGVRARHVIPGLPAARAGLAAGDLITGFWFGSPPRPDAPIRALGASPWDERVLGAVLLTVGRGTTLRLRIGRGPEARLVDLAVDGPGEGDIMEFRELDRSMKTCGFLLADRIVAVVVDGARAPVLDSKGLMPALKAIGGATPGVDSTFVIARGTALHAVRFRAPRALLGRPGDPYAELPVGTAPTQPPGSGLLVEGEGAGLKAGDRIELARSPDGKRWPIRDFIDLADLLLPLHVGDRVGLTVRRGEDVVEVEVTLVARPSGD
jgi:hypothetical protein